MFSIAEGSHTIKVGDATLTLTFGAKLPIPEAVKDTRTGSRVDPVTGETITHAAVHADDDASKCHLLVVDPESGEGTHVVFNRNGSKLSEHDVVKVEYDEDGNPIAVKKAIEPDQGEDHLSKEAPTFLTRPSGQQPKAGA